MNTTTVLITGGHKGLGLRTTRTIAAGRTHDLILGGRNLPEVETVAAQLRSGFGVNARAILLDVSSLASTRAAAAATQRLIAQREVAPLSTLILNAGAQFMGPIEYSVDGYEQTFAANCLGHFLLMNLLLDDLATDGRVVWTASGTHDPETMDGRIAGKALEPDAFLLAKQGKGGKPASGGKRYSTSKLCVILYAYELDRRLRARGSSIASIAFDPGLIVETGLFRSSAPIAQRLMRSAFGKWMFKVMGITIGSTDFSGDSLARIAVDPAFSHASGKYLQSTSGQLIDARSSKASYNIDYAKRLWSQTEQLAQIGGAQSARVS